MILHQSCNTRCVAIFVFIILSIPPSQLIAARFSSSFQKLTANDAGAHDKFGRSIALNGNTALVASLHLGNSSYDGSVGAAYVFRESARGDWTEQVKLVQTDRPLGNGFGWSVAINGTTAIVGAPFDGDGFIGSTGAAYLFGEDEHGDWTQLAKLLPPAETQVRYFGDSVDISGNIVIVGAPTGGTAFLYRDDGNGIWTEVSTLGGSDSTAPSDFGTAVAIDGNTAIVGASSFGARFAQIFREDTSGQWNRVATLTGSGGPISYFGEAVDIYETTAIVGAKGIGERAIYIFHEDQNGVWNQVFNFTFPGSHAEDYDKLVSISGHFALASARPSGDIYVFHEDAQGEWSLFDQLSMADGGYGFSSAIDGNTMLVAAMWDDAIALDAGAAYVFHLVPEPSSYGLGIVVSISFALMRARRLERCR